MSRSNLLSNDLYIKTGTHLIFPTYLPPDKLATERFQTPGREKAAVERDEVPNFASTMFYTGVIKGFGFLNFSFVSSNLGFVESERAVLPQCRQR